MSFPYPQGFEELIRKEDFLCKLSAIFSSWSFLPHDWNRRFKFGASAPKLRAYITRKVSNRDFWYEKLLKVKGVYMEIIVVNDSWDVSTNCDNDDAVIVITTAVEWQGRVGESPKRNLFILDSANRQMTNDQSWEGVKVSIKRWMDTWF